MLSAVRPVVSSVMATSEAQVSAVQRRIRRRSTRRPGCWVRQTPAHRRRPQQRRQRCRRAGCDVRLRTWLTPASCADDDPTIGQGRSTRLHLVRQQSAWSSIACQPRDRPWRLSNPTFDCCQPAPLISWVDGWWINSDDVGAHACSSTPGRQRRAIDQG